MSEAFTLEGIAAAFRRSAYLAYRNTLIGSAPPAIEAAFKRMTTPQIGDWVIEASTIGLLGRHDLNGIGILDEIAWEKVDFGDPSFVWDEAEEGRPHPTEKVFYLITMDGRRFRWTNAQVVAVLLDDPISRLAPLKAVS